MKTYDITSSRLPNISDSVKECVNMGEWLLFRPENAPGGSDAEFYLKTPKSVFALGSRGEVLCEVNNYSRGIGEVYYFSDAPKPFSLSNLRVA